MTRFFYLLLTLVTLAAGPASAQSTAAAFYPITAKLGPYKQTFDAMSSTGAPTFTNGSNASLPGIIAGFKYFTGVFGSSPQANPNDGSNASSTAYNFGTTGATDRALGGMAGSLAGGTNTTGYVCVRLRNRSKASIRNFDIRYALEQWYNSSNAQDAYVQASYRVYNDTTSFNTNDIVQDNGVNGWTDIPSLKLQAPATGGLVGKADGNSTTYRRTAQYRLTNINLANAKEIVVRFSYVFNSATNGNGVSVDDIVIYPETNVFYSSTTGNLNSTAANGTWTQNADGSGQVGSAIDFAAPNVTYYVQGTNTASRLSGNWAVTGTNSRVVVGTNASPASLYLAPGDNLAAVVDVASGSTLKLGDTPTGLALGTLAANSTVEYASASTTTAQRVLPASYAKLNLSGASLKTLAGDVTVADALTLTSASASTPQAAQLNDYDLTLLRNATLARTNGGQIITNGTGEYRATVIGAGSNSTAVLFPVALSAAAADYLPVSITAGVNSKGNDKDEMYQVRVVNGVYNTYSATGAGSNPSTYAGNVNATWHISHETSTPVSAALDMDWAASREGGRFVAGTSFLDHYDSGTNKWDAVAEGSTPKAGPGGRRGVKRQGVSKFSPFAITSSQPTALPVVLVSFEARRVGATVACAWVTASELRSSHFVVERSRDGAYFEALGTVTSYGTSTAEHTYRFADAQPLAGAAYYRLRQVDLDGTASFSPVVAVQGGELAAAITAVPNPSAGRFALQTNFPVSATLRGTVVNMLGQSVLTLNEQVPAGAASLPLDLSAQPAGVYLVQLHGPAGATTLRLLKQ